MAAEYCLEKARSLCTNRTFAAADVCWGGVWKVSRPTPEKATKSQLWDLGFSHSPAVGAFYVMFSYLKGVQDTGGLGPVYNCSQSFPDVHRASGE